MYVFTCHLYQLLLIQILLAEVFIIFRKINKQMQGEDFI